MTTTDGGGASAAATATLDRARAEAIARLEAALDAQLSAARRDARPSDALRTAAREWSEQVWQTACTLGPSPLSADGIERGLDLARRPVFVCGVHRSGTTLLRDLLDGHPSLVVLPSEGSFLQSAAASLKRLRGDDRAAFLGREWLRRLANPINQPPYWLLGRTGEDDSPYVRFARALLAWWPEAERRLARETSIWPLTAIALAYGSVSAEPREWDRLVRWVEKTPTNEQQLVRLRADFPDARIVHVIRHPLDVFASRRTLEERAIGRFAGASQVLRDLRATYRIALEESSRGDRHYGLVRYERLVRSAPEVMQNVAAALDIEMTPVMLEPTVAGHPAMPNSSFRADAHAGQILSSARSAGERLSARDRDLVAAVVGESAVALGYDVDRVSGWRARWTRLRRGVW